MNVSVPGMDPYVEHPILWESFHGRLIHVIVNHLQPQLDPRYIVSPGERVFIECPQQRIPDLWIEKVSETWLATVVAPAEVDAAIILEVASLEIHQKRVEILDAYNAMNLVLVCVSRSRSRNRFELYPRRLRERLPRIKIPLAEPDPDARLDIQAALEQVYVEGRYSRRVRNHEPCEPSLPPADQAWATESWAAYRQAHPELFPPPPNGGTP